MPRQSRNIFEFLDRRLRALSDSVGGLEAARDFSLPIYAITTNPPQEAIEGQWAINKDDGKPWYYWQGVWHECVCGSALILMVNNVDAVFPIENYDVDILDEFGPYTQDTYLIAVMNEDQVETYPLPQPNYEQLNPVWNYTQDRIAYTRYHRFTGQRDLCTMKNDGSEHFVVLPNHALGRYAEGKAFSPDGTKIGWTSYGGAEGYYTKVINADGTGTIKTAPDEPTGFYVLSWDELPHFSADSDYIISVAYHNITNHEHLVRWNFDTDVVESIINLTQYGLNLGYPDLGINTMFDINANNICVAGIYNHTGPPLYNQVGPALMFIECVPNASPTMIDTEDMPDYNWEIYGQSVTSYTPSAPNETTPLDTFTRANGALGTDWEDFYIGVGFHHRIENNQVRLPVRTTGPDNAGSTWLATGNISDAYAMITLKQIDANTSMFISLRSQFIGTGGGASTYYQVLINRPATGTNFRVTLLKITNGVTLYQGYTYNLPVAYLPYPIGLRAFGDTVQMLVNSGIYDSYVDASPLAAGRIQVYTQREGVAPSTNDIYWDDFRAGAASSADIDFQSYETPYTVWWNNAGNRVGWTQEVPTPPGGAFFREWIMLSMLPDTSGFVVMGHAPNAIAGTNAAFTGYTYETSWPPQSTDSYVSSFDGLDRMIFSHDTYDPALTDLAEDQNGWTGIVGRTIDDPDPIHIMYNKAQTSVPAWDYGNDWGEGPEYPTGLVISDDFNRANSANLGAAWTPLASSPLDIASNAVTGEGRERYDTEAAFPYGMGIMTIIDLASIRYEIGVVPTYTTGHESVNAFYDHSTGQLGTIIHSQYAYNDGDISSFETTTLSAGDRIGFKLVGYELHSYYQKGSDPWKWSGSFSTYAAHQDSSGSLIIPGNYQPLHKSTIAMSGGGGKVDDFGVWPYTPDYTVWSRYAPTGLPVQTWQQDQTHDFHY